MNAVGTGMARRRGLRVREILASLLVGVTGCMSQNGDTEMAVRATEARFADTLAGERIPPRGYAWVVFGPDTVVAEVAETPAQREEGLMYRQELADGSGMLFVFQNEVVRSFWMRDTYVPLDIAFMSQGMEIVDIQQMEPETEEYYTSSGPAMFALEVPQGWFDAHGVGEGDSPEIIFGPR